MARGLPIHKNDTVRVMAGRDKGKEGRVLEVEPRKNRLYVEHINMIKRHTRPNPSKQIRGGVLDKEGPIDISNVALICGDCGPVRIQHREKAEGKKVRVCVKCGKVLDI
ncbi:MAG: 50S ribosomal protein L24 [Acidobacteriota bacterium]|nr:50S ribosomal protein L24 [Acidobacteriota bacterium]